jgi:hypothetical protein
VVSDNPYLIHGPALISFSGGRTSAYMLKMILDSHGGTLPDDVHVCFANTGKEREETLRFVHECESRWGVRVRWLEWRKRHRGDPWADGFTEVGYNSASRNGEPFAAVIADRQMLPNPVTRYCTQQLKIRTMEMFMRAQGYERWNNAVGLRRDEMHRVFKQIERNEKGIDRFTAQMPMASAKANVSKPIVMRFWCGDLPEAVVVEAYRRADRAVIDALPQGFDLGIFGWEGNCDNCFLKNEALLKWLIRGNPASAEWWIEQERLHEGKTRDPRMSKFNKAFTYQALLNDRTASPLLPINDEHDAECGLWCAGEGA